MALGCMKDWTGYPKSWPNEAAAAHIRKNRHHQARVKSQTFDPTYFSSCTNLDQKDKAGGRFNHLCKVLISDIFFFYVCHFHCLTLQTLSCSICFPKVGFRQVVNTYKFASAFLGAFVMIVFVQVASAAKNHFCRCFWAYWMEGAETKTLKWWRIVLGDYKQAFKDSSLLLYYSSPAGKVHTLT